MKPEESDRVTTLAPSSLSLATQNVATLPEPETTQVLPSNDSPACFNMFSIM